MILYISNGILINESLFAIFVAFRRDEHAFAIFVFGSSRKIYQNANSIEFPFVIDWCISHFDMPQSDCLLGNIQLILVLTNTVQIEQSFVSNYSIDFT